MSKAEGVTSLMLLKWELSEQSWRLSAIGWDSWDHCPIHVVMKKEKVSNCFPARKGKKWTGMEAHLNQERGDGEKKWSLNQKKMLRLPLVKCPTARKQKKTTHIGEWQDTG